MKHLCRWQGGKYRAQSLVANLHGSNVLARGIQMHCQSETEGAKISEGIAGAS